MATGEQLRFFVGAVLIDWPDGVNDVPRQKMAAAGDHRPSRRQAAVRRNVLPAFLEDSRPTAPMDSAVNASPSPKRRISRVYDRLGRLVGYVRGAAEVDDLVRRRDNASRRVF